MPLILTELSFTDIDSFIRDLDSFIRIKALRATNTLANSKEFIQLITDASISYIINNQSNYTKLSDEYQKRKGNFDIFFGTKEEIMIRDILSGKAFQISYEDGDILVEIINKIAIYHTLGSGNLPIRPILEITDKFRNEIFDLAVLILIEEFNKKE